MTDWGDQVEAEYEMIRRGLRPWSADEDPVVRGWDDRHAILVRPRRSWWPLVLVSVVGVAILWLTAVGVFDGRMPAWLGALMVAGAGVACWVVEKWG